MQRRDVLQRLLLRLFRIRERFDDFGERTVSYRFHDFRIGHRVAGVLQQIGLLLNQVILMVSNKWLYHCFSAPYL